MSSVWNKIGIGLAALLAGVVIGATLLGCSGPDPTGVAVSTALDEGYGVIRDDAALGVRLRSDPAPEAEAARQRFGVAKITPEMAAFATETQDYHSRIIDLSRQRALGQVDRTQPLPAGPTLNGSVQPRGP